MSDFIASQDPGQQPCGSRDDQAAPATAALATHLRSEVRRLSSALVDCSVRVGTPGEIVNASHRGQALADVRRICDAALDFVPPRATASTTPADGNAEVAAPVIQQPREDQKTAFPLDRIDVEGLKAAAEKATPGSWGAHRTGSGWSVTAPIRSPSRPNMLVAYCLLPTRGLRRPEENATYIAAANPATILALLAERAELIAQRAALVDMTEELVGLMEAASIDEINATVAKALALLSSITGGGE